MLISWGPNLIAFGSQLMEWKRLSTVNGLSTKGGNGGRKFVKEMECLIKSTNITGEIRIWLIIFYGVVCACLYVLSEDVVPGVVLLYFSRLVWSLEFGMGRLGKKS